MSFAKDLIDERDTLIKECDILHSLIMLLMSTALSDTHCSMLKAVLAEHGVTIDADFDTLATSNSKDDEDDTRAHEPPLTSGIEAVSDSEVARPTLETPIPLKVVSKLVAPPAPTRSRTMPSILLQLLKCRPSVSTDGHVAKVSTAVKKFKSSLVANKA